MFIALFDKNNKKSFTHSSLLEDEKVAQITEIRGGEQYYRRGLMLFTGLIMLEATCRLPYFKAKPLYLRALSFAVPVLIAKYLSNKLYWNSFGKKQEVLKLCNNAPIYSNCRDVPELDKAFFFLDDDNNYEPSLLHHAV